MARHTPVQVPQDSVVTQCFLVLMYLKNTGCLFSSLCLDLGLVGARPVDGCSLCFVSDITEVISGQSYCMVCAVRLLTFNTWPE